MEAVVHKIYEEEKEHESDGPAKGPSLGMIRPQIKAPNMTLIPMRSVRKAAPKTMTKVAATTDSGMGSS
jgi:hypothetical protein